MVLHKDLENFKALISLTAKDMGILEFYIEKDYWVTYILKKLSSSSFKNDVVFKGGTSLSKGYNAINRFSEDIDLQLTKSSLGDNQKKKLLKNIEETITEGMIYLPKHPRESKRGNIRKTIYQYQIQINEEDKGQVSDVIVLEINSLSTPEPTEILEIESYIAKYLRKIGKEEFIPQFELESFKINVLSVKRTFIEKLFAVLDYTFEENAEVELGNKIRHLYDLHKLYQLEEIKDFLKTEDSYKMASKVVVQNDFFGKRKDTIYRNSFLYNDFERINKIESVYNTKFKAMVFGEFPDFESLKDTLKILLDFIDKWEKEYRIEEIKSHN